MFCYICNERNDANLTVVSRGISNESVGADKELLIFSSIFSLTHSTERSLVWELLGLPTRMWSLIARFMGPTWGPSGADSTQVGPMLAPWALLSGMFPGSSYIQAKPHLAGVLSACCYPIETNQLSVSKKWNPIPFLVPPCVNTFYTNKLISLRTCSSTPLASKEILQP